MDFHLNLNSKHCSNWYCTYHSFKLITYNLCLSGPDQVAYSQKSHVSEWASEWRGEWGSGRAVATAGWVCKQASEWANQPASQPVSQSDRQADSQSVYHSRLWQCHECGRVDILFLYVWTVYLNRVHFMQERSREEHRFWNNPEGIVPEIVQSSVFSVDNPNSMSYTRMMCDAKQKTTVQ